MDKHMPDQLPWRNLQQPARGKELFRLLAWLRFWHPNAETLKQIHGDIDDEFIDIYERCKDFTMTPVLRMYNLYNATRYVVKRNIPGDIVECGVWKGGSAMIAALTLLSLNDTSRRIYLYDTFQGMSEPTERDVTRRGQRADLFLPMLRRKTHAPLEEVEQNLLLTGYPKDQLVLVKGRVEDTIPATIPEAISVLRLDTDWYESTYHELVHLFPLLSQNGVVILDDYGYWRGHKQAADQYFQEGGIEILLMKIDNTARIAIKS